MTTRKQFTRAEFHADPGAVAEYAAKHGPVGVVDDTGVVVWRVSVPKAEKEPDLPPVDRDWMVAWQRCMLKDGAAKLEKVVNDELQRLHGPNAPTWTVTLPDEIAKG